MTLPPDPPAVEPIWESVAVGGSVSADIDDEDDDGRAGDREPLNPQDEPPELAVEVER